MPKREGAGRKPLSRENMLVASLAREYTEAAIDQLYHLMLNAPENSVRKSAADSLLDRGWGKPAQANYDLGEEKAKQVFGWLPTQN